MTPDLAPIGRLLILMALLLFLVGLLFLGLARLPGLGRLPGDLYIQRGNLSCFVPIATSILLSLLLTVGLNVLLWLLRRLGG
ncbi:MAG: DUF2905 domain-containing protein [Ardenticatenia bacterium]|nr:DUF2905 domain-containing protein [Ardenticatenia bacterium]